MTRITVLLSSGETDVWEEAAAVVDLDLGGTLVVFSEGQTWPAATPWAWYAPGMWMKVEFE